MLRIERPPIGRDALAKPGRRPGTRCVASGMGDIHHRPNPGPADLAAALAIRNEQAAEKAGELARRDEAVADSAIFIDVAGCWVSQRFPPGDPRALSH